MKIMEEQKEAKEESTKKNVLENGTYSIYGPENGDVMFDTLELHAGGGATRIWKVEEFGRDKVVFKVVKFG